jgi:hypothetical protein
LPLQLFFPPKWGINEKVAAAEELRPEVGESECGEPVSIEMQMGPEDSLLRVVAGADDAEADPTEMPILGPIRQAAG